MNTITAPESDVAGDLSKRSGPTRFVEVYRPCSTRYAPGPDGTEVVVETTTHTRWYPFTEGQAQSGPSVDGRTRIEWTGNDRSAYLLWVVGGEWIQSKGKPFLRTSRHKALDADMALRFARAGDPSIGVVILRPARSDEELLDLPFDQVVAEIAEGIHDRPTPPDETDLERMAADHLWHLIEDSPDFDPDLDWCGNPLESPELVEVVAGDVPDVAAVPTSRAYRGPITVALGPPPEVAPAPTTQLGFGWSDSPKPKTRPKRKGRENPGDAPGWEGVARG